MNKLCVYAICKNELKNLEKWLKSISQADLIVLIDTGSTDGTYEYLQSFNNQNLVIDQLIQEEFDFSIARNFALQKAFELTDESWIYLSLDLDEFLEEDGVLKIKNNWVNNYDTMRLKGITSENDYQYIDHKIHSGNREWFWHRAIHEIIKLPNKKQKEWNIGFAATAYIHCQDLNKTRDYYEKLLKAYEKNPNDIKTVIYLAWESANHEQYDDVLKYNLECIDLIFHNTEDEYYMDYEYLIQCQINIANYYLDKGNWTIAYGYLLSCYQLIENGFFPKIRRIYYLLANINWKYISKEKAIDMYYECLNIETIPYCWVEDEYLYDNSVIYRDLANAYFYTDNFKMAYVYAQKAYELDKSRLNYDNLLIIKRRYKDGE